MKLLEKIKSKSNIQGVIMLGIFIVLSYLLLFYLNTESFRSFRNIIKNKNVERFTNYGNGNKGPLNCYLFYAYNCPHSQKFLQTHWKNLSNKYSNKIVFNKIDCHHPNTKGICKIFNVKETPTILITTNSYNPGENNNNRDDIVEFTEERTSSNFENFLVQQISKYERESFQDSTQINTNTDPNINAPTTRSVVDDVEFSQTEDPKAMKAQYCIKYKDPIKSDLNRCQNIDEKLIPNVKAWQGAYTLMNEFIKTNAKTLEEKNELAYKVRNNIADWHLCDPDILNTLEKNIGVMENNQDDMDTIKSIKFACGFSN